jgi:hypothetical protein
LIGVADLSYFLDHDSAQTVSYKYYWSFLLFDSLALALDAVEEHRGFVCYIRDCTAGYSGRVIAVGEYFTLDADFLKCQRDGVAEPADITRRPRI